jgi:hypothetical protein
MSGLRILLNNQDLAAVSNRKRNIISAYVSGDVIGPELATAHLIGGYYGDPQDTSHRIWLDGVVLTEGDEIEIQFLNSISTSGSGMSIEEHAEAHAKDKVSEEVDDEDMHTWLALQPKVRECFSFELEMPSYDLIKTKTGLDDFSFHFGVMWKWTNPDEASVHLSSASLENMKQKKAGTTHCKLKLHPGQGVKFRVGT